jgi:hypothetical protein
MKTSSKMLLLFSRLTDIMLLNKSSPPPPVTDSSSLSAEVSGMNTLAGVPSFVVISINYQPISAAMTVVAPPEYQRHLNAVYSMPSSEFEDGG